LTRFTRQIATVSFAPRRPAAPMPPPCLRNTAPMEGRRLTPAMDETEQRAPLPQLDLTEPPQGSDRRAFMMRSALAAAIATLTGRPLAAFADTPAKAPSPKLDPKLDVVRKSKGPVMTTLEEFYKVGPGPSSSHTIGPMRITYDFYQRCTKLPEDQLKQA